MEDSQGYYDHEDEIIRLHINLGNAETKSNGHRRRVKPIDMVNTMKSLQSEVKRYR
jgi:hypothetical protein